MRKILLIPTPLTIVSMPLMSLSACTQENVKIFDFNTCGWSIVANACNKLEKNGDTEAFCKKFKVYDLSTEEPDDKKIADTLDDFVGQPRTVKLYGLEHNVIVVGYQQDYFDVEHQKPISLTFQFNDLISILQGVALTIMWDPANPTNYWTSLLNTTLNETVFNSIKNESQNDNLADNIKLSYRVVNTFHEDLGWIPTGNQTKLFCPAIANYFSREGIMNSACIDHDYHEEEYYYNEGSQYLYYKKNENIGDKTLDEEIACLKFLCVGGNPYLCWTTSPKIDSNLKSAWYSFSGQMGIAPTYLPNAASFAPCFCL